MKQYLRPWSFFTNTKPEMYSCINLNQFYLTHKDEIPDTKDPRSLDKLLQQLEFITYGGYGENRADLWKGTYLDNGEKYIHLGVDINVVSGTSIVSPFDSVEIVDIFADTDTEVGWGGRLILKLNDRFPFIVLGHLNPFTMPIVTGIYPRGTLLGTVGPLPINGNVFHHLHLQLTTNSDFSSLDGYGTQKDLLSNPCPFTTPI